MICRGEIYFETSGQEEEEETWEGWTQDAWLGLVFMSRVIKFSFSYYFFWVKFSFVMNVDIWFCNGLMSLNQIYIQV